MSLNAIVPAGKRMPLWDDLASSLAKEMDDYEYSGALDAISAYAHQFYRSKLVERLSDLILVDSAKPGEVHRAFCSIKFPIVCTTNFDFLLERQYDVSPRYCRPLIYEDQLSIPVREPGVQLLKLHGDVHHPDRLVVTEEDYDGFVQRHPLIATYLANLLITKTAIFIGYSLDDPDMRQVSQLILDRLGKARRPTYALRVGATPQEIARFERRGVRVINFPGKKQQYGQILTQVFDELRGYQEANVLPASQVTDEAVLRELQFPPGSSYRLCYFAVPFALASRYKESVFPIAQEYGFVPVTADNILSPGDSVAAKIDALLTRAGVAVIDVGTNWTEVELRIALSKMAPDSILMITEALKTLPFDIANMRVLVRPKTDLSEAEAFLEQVRGWFASRAEVVRPQIEEEPERLLVAMAPRAAIVAAITLLETRLRKRLDLATKSLSRPMAFIQIARLAIQNGLIVNEDMQLIQEWLRLRNAAIHTATPISMHDAHSLVQGVRSLIERRAL